MTIYISILIGVALSIGAVLGWISFFRHRQLETKVERLQREIRLLREAHSSDQAIQRLRQQHQHRENGADVAESDKAALGPTQTDAVTSDSSAPHSSETDSADSDRTTPDTGESGVTNLSGQDVEEKGETAQPEYEFDLNLDLPDESQNSASRVSAQAATQSKPRVNQPQNSKVSASPSVWQQLLDNWMIWLGGACVGLAGIFLVKYSVEQGLLGPGARIIAGLILGLSLHAGAEYLRRTLSHHASFAALAGGGSITLFATLLSALQMYQLISPGLAFVLMALVAVITLGLALLHGPVLAALGMLGAYAVPILVSTGSGNAVSALIYSLIISAATLVLIRKVFRPWLWYGLLVGALGWWLLTLGAVQADGVRGWYLALLAYFILVVSGRDGLYDWLIAQVQASDDETWRLQQRSQSAFEALVLPSFALIIVAQALSILLSGFDTNALSLFLQWSPLAVVVLLGMRQREHLAPLPWLLFGLQLVAWLGSQVDLFHASDALDHQLAIVPLQDAEANSVFIYLAMTAALFSVLSLWALTRASFPWRQLSISLATMAPLLTLGLAYSLSTQWTVSWQWSLCSILLGTVYLSWAAKILRSNERDQSAIWLLLSGHMAYALATAMVLREASLTLALAMLVVSLSWVIQKFEIPRLSWLLKAMVALVIMRLSLNPWLATYPVDVHWSLWSYGGAALCCGVAAWLLSRRGENRSGVHSSSSPSVEQALVDRALSDASRWVGAAALHLFVLFVWTETRYWLYDGDVFSARYDFLEAAINATFFGALALVYYHRGEVSDQLRRVYHLGSFVLMAMAATNYGVVIMSTLASADWAVLHIGSRKFVNLTLLAYGAPALVAYMSYRCFEPSLRRVSAIVAGLAAFIFISIQIRHFWQGSIDLSLPTSSGELYTYSVVWLALAIAIILGGSWVYSSGSVAAQQTYRAGMILLALVIVKLFLIDMSDLQGLLRVASFMGLGLALLGIAYLHKRLSLEQGES
ncbi:MAG: DUF2339 domain-containing protein [Cellvibrionaceae bacterium]